MKEITILSGKGGTGKTSVTAALASLTNNAVFCDNDVDAADLHLLLNPKIEIEHTFRGAWVAHIDENICTACGICTEYCRFDAIHPSNNAFQINEYQCEGCRLCEKVCPHNAITSEQSTKNKWFISSTRFGKLVHATMVPGEENSGKLVALIRENARKIAQQQKSSLLINDGPPGVGCTAISSITGTDHVLLVIEPTQSGLHDAKRVIELVNKFNIGISAIINKYDLNENVSALCESYLKQMNIPLLGKIPFDKEFVQAMVQKKTIVEYNKNSISSKTIENAFQQIVKML